MRKLSLWILAVPYLLYYLGVGMNVAVICANRGTMPVAASPWNGVDNPDGQDTIHVKMTTESRLKVLADWVQLPAYQATASPGDLFIWLGVWLTVPSLFFWLGLILERHAIHRP